MRKACFYINGDETVLKDHFFWDNTYEDRMKSGAYAFRELKKELLKYNVELSTQDINLPEESALVFCLDMPHHFTGIKKIDEQVWCLFMFDPPIYCPESWDPGNHAEFDYIFTFNKNLVDNKKYFHYTFAIDTEHFPFPTNITEDIFLKRKLCTFVSSAMQGMKDKKNPNSLLYERYLAVKWFGTHHPEDFDFYGSSFEKSHFHLSFKGVGILKRILPKKIFYAIAKAKQRKLLNVYKGSLPALDKIETSRNYNFYLCYENTLNINGYLTEKIFDCFYSSTVPVYRGASNVRELIPYKCYIDGNEFKDLANLYSFIKNMPYHEYRGYIEEARLFLKSGEMEKFTVKHFVHCIVDPLKEILVK